MFEYKIIALKELYKLSIYYCPGCMYRKSLLIKDGSYHPQCQVVLIAYFQAQVYCTSTKWGQRFFEFALLKPYKMLRDVFVLR